MDRDDKIVVYGCLFVAAAVAICVLITKWIVL